jgi:glycerophosphoryl diester phosphodiesterase
MRPRVALAALVILLVGAAPAAAANPWRQPRQPWNIAHQGGEDEFPSNTLYAFKRAKAAGADMLELDIGVTRDNRIVVSHDTTVDRTTNGHGTIASQSLRALRRLDAAFWFAPGRADPYRHGRRAAAYRLRGAATGRRPPPPGFRATDFRMPTLSEVLRAFPRTPINIEIKARTKAETTPEYVRNAEVLARLLRTVARRDLIVVSFRQEAVDRFHALVPGLPVAPGIAGAANWLLKGDSPGAGVVAFQLPITYRLGTTTVPITTPAAVRRAHAEGYAWQVWLSDDGEGRATWNRLLDACADGVMTARPVAFERLLRERGTRRGC